MPLAKVFLLCLDTQNWRRLASLIPRLNRFGSSPAGAAQLLHTMTGVVFYVLGYLLVARPIQRSVVPALHWSLTALAYGIVLWVFALYIMAHLVAGLPAFLGFTGITWVALWGHILFAVIAAWVIEAHGIAFDVKTRRITSTV